MLRKVFSFGGLLLLGGALCLATPGLAQTRGGGAGGGGYFGDNPGGFRRAGSYLSGHGGSPYSAGYGYDLSGLGPVTQDSGYRGSYWDSMPSYPYGYFSATPPSPSATDTSAHISVAVPAGARVWFGGAPTTSTGPAREYISPALAPGRQYTYEVRARWNDNGQDVTQTQQVTVSAGAHVNVAFPSPPAQKR